METPWPTKPGEFQVIMSKIGESGCLTPDEEDYISALFLEARGVSARVSGGETPPSEPSEAQSDEKPSDVRADALREALYLLADEAYESGMEIGELIEERRAGVSATPLPAAVEPCAASGDRPQPEPGPSNCTTVSAHPRASLSDSEGRADSSVPAPEAAALIEPPAIDWERFGNSSVPPWPAMRRRAIWLEHRVAVLVARDEARQAEIEELEARLRRAEEGQR